MNKDNDFFNKILFFVFVSALLLGAYIILGPKVTALIRTDGSVNEMNLSGTFRIYMFVQFISLCIAAILLISQVVRSLISGLGLKPSHDKNFLDYLGWFFSLFSIGGAIIVISWFFFFISRSYQSIVWKLHENKFSREYFFNGILGFPFILKDKYTHFFQKRKNYLFLKGMLSLLFWAILSLFLVVIIRFQAGTDGCEYSWRGDTQDRETIIREARFFGAPIRHFVKIPQEADVDYLDYMKNRIDYSGTLNNQENAPVPFKPEFNESKTCWRRYILGILLFYAVFLRVLLAFFYYVIYKCTERSFSSLHDLIHDHGETITQIKASARPFPKIKEQSAVVTNSEPYLLLAFGYGIDLSPADWESLLPDDSNYLVTYGNVFGKEKGTLEGSGHYAPSFTELLTENGTDVSDMITILDLCRPLIVDDLDFFSNNVLLNLPYLRHCQFILSNGEKLRLMSSNPNSVEERVDDWKEKLSKLCQSVCEQRNQSFSFETVDWYDTEFRTLASDLILKTYLQKEFAGRFGDGNSSLNDSQSHFLLPHAFKIIPDSFNKYVSQLDKLDITANDWEDRFQQIFKEHLREGESRLVSLYTTGKNQPAVNEFAGNAAVIAGNVFDKGRDLFTHGMQIAGDVKESLRGNPLILRRVGTGIAKKFIPQKNLDTSARHSALYNANREFVKLLTEYALTLEFQGRPLVWKARLIDQIIDEFSSASQSFDRNDLKLMLSDIAKQIERENF